MHDLSEIYWREHGLEGLQLEDFLDKVAGGAYGTFTAQDIKEFLLNMEHSILENIELKAGETPQFALMKDEIVAETIERFRLLRERYAR